MNATENLLPDPVPAADVDHDALYATFRRLLMYTGRILADVDGKSSELYRHADALRVAHADGCKLLWPDPPPEAPDGATVLFARALHPGDSLFHLGVWRKIATLEWDAHDRVVVTFHAVSGGFAPPQPVRGDQPVAVIRAAAEPSK